MRYFLLLLFLSFPLEAQVCWEPNDVNLDGRLRSSDHRVGDVAVIANELAAISRSTGDVIVTDFFVASLISKSPSGKNVKNNVIEAMLDKLNILSEFKRGLVNDYNQGMKILDIKNGEIVLVNEYKAESWTAENVQISPQVKELFTRAEEVKNIENNNKGAGEGSSFYNNFKGLEHFLVGAMKMRGNFVSDFLNSKITAPNTGRFTSNNKKENVRVNALLDLLTEVRGDKAKNGVTSRTAYENYAQGNGKSFYTEKTDAIDPPSFLNDMVSKMIDGGYGPVYVRANLVLDLANILLGKGKNSVELHSEFDGMGKKHVVLGLVKMLADIRVNGRNSEYYDILPRELHDLRLYEADLTTYLGSKENDTQFRGATEKTVKDLIDFSESLNGQAVVVFNDMGGVYNLGQTQGSQGLGQQLVAPISKAKNDPTQGLRVIAITNKITAKEVSTTGWTSHVERMTVSKPSKEQINEIAQIHFDRIKEDNQRIERESLSEVFDYAYEVAQRYPNLGDGLTAVFRIYDHIATQLRRTGDSRATENHVLIAASRLLENTPVMGGRYVPPRMGEYIQQLETNLNNSIRERGQIIEAVVSRIQAGLYASTPVVEGVVRPKARSVTILVGPSGTLKTSILEMLAKELKMEFDKIAGSQVSESTLFEIARKVREENPSRIVYITEANLARNIFQTLENMIDGIGITDPNTGRVTTFENVHFVLDGNIPKAEQIARNFGFSETVPDALIEQLNRETAREQEKLISGIKDTGEATYVNSNGQRQIVTIDAHPHGVVKFTDYGRTQYNNAVRDAFGGREAFMGRAGQPIAVGYLSKGAYKATVDFVERQQNLDINESNNGSSFTITDRAKEYIADLAMLDVNIELGARFTEQYIGRLVTAELRRQVWSRPDLYMSKDGFFVGKFRAVMDVHPNGTGIVVDIKPSDLISEVIH